MSYLIKIVDVHELCADRAAVSLFQPRYDFAQRQSFLFATNPVGCRQLEDGVQVRVLDLGAPDDELPRLLLGHVVDVEGVDLGGQMASHLIRSDCGLHRQVGVNYFAGGRSASDHSATGARSSAQVRKGWSDCTERDFIGSGVICKNN